MGGRGSEQGAQTPAARNALLSALDVAYGGGPVVGAQAADVRAGQVTGEPGGPVTHVLFPLSAVFGLLLVLPDASEVQVLAVGREGAVGLPEAIARTSSPYRVVCQVPGRVVRVPASAVPAWLGAEPARWQQVARYQQARTVLLSHRVACAHRHSAEQRCAAWLLKTADRVAGPTFALTQRSLAGMLSVQRTTVSAAANSLQDAGLISYRYGRVTVRDRAGLEQLACSCYAVFRAEFDALLAGGTTQPGGDGAA